MALTSKPSYYSIPLAVLGGTLLLLLAGAAPTASAWTTASSSEGECSEAYENTVVCVGGEDCHFIVGVGASPYYSPDPTYMTGVEALFLYHRPYNCSNSGIGSCTASCVWVAYFGEGYGTPP